MKINLDEFTTINNNFENDANQYIESLIQKNQYIKELNSQLNFLSHLDQSNEFIPILIDINSELNDVNISNRQFITSISLNEDGEFKRELVKNPKYGDDKKLINNVKNYSNYNLGNHSIDYSNEPNLNNQVKKNIQGIIDKLSIAINAENKKGFVIFNFKSVLYPKYKNNLIFEIISKVNNNENKIIYSTIFYLAESLKSKIKYPQEYQYLIDELKNCDYLIIDEINFLKTSYWFLNVLLTTILIYRIECNKKTIFLSELSKEDFDLLVNKSMTNVVDSKDSSIILSKRIAEKKYEEFLEIFNNLFDYLELK